MRSSKVAVLERRDAEVTAVKGKKKCYLNLLLGKFNRKEGQNSLGMWESINQSSDT